MIVVGLTGGIGAGKSTVSKLLAERGAAIVDADEIARDLQAPGAPVVLAMAERFGDHIIDADGALIRPEVAKIVFSDERALKDLNGIVHPAMQAEIQRQIDAHADTDRLVVLDFPLLGENPRKGLAATIVVDIPYDLAVQRVVEFRGMSHEDAQNRINSQISREQRLETATHVIDNSGDLVDLVAQVDRLWDQLIALPPTTSDDAAEEPAGGRDGDGDRDGDRDGGRDGDRDRDSHRVSDRDGAGHLAVDPSTVDRSGETVWIFGYGSLVSPKSMARTIGRVAVHQTDFFLADLDGYGRRWNYGVVHMSGQWTRDDGVEIDDGTIVALGVVEAAGETVNGVVASIAGGELVNLDRRERNYDRVEVTDRITVLDDEDDVVVGPIYTYVPRPTAVEAYTVGRDAGTAGVRRTYWDLCEAAFAAFGDDHLARYRSSTPDPDIPIVDLVSAHER